MRLSRLSAAIALTLVTACFRSGFSSPPDADASSRGDAGGTEAGALDAAGADAMGGDATAGDVPGTDAATRDRPLPEVCVTDSPAELCAALGGEPCGSLTVTDSCGQVRSVDCGVCAPPLRCHAMGNINQCGAELWYPLGLSDPWPWSESFVSASASGGGLSSSPWDSPYPILGLDDNGLPTVAWMEVHPTYSIHLRQWNGSAWIELDNSGSGSGISGGDTADWPNMRLDESGRPLVVWSGDGVQLRRWSGSAWVGIAGSDGAGGIGGAPQGRPTLVKDHLGRVVVAWVDTIGGGSGYSIYVRRLEGVAWQELAGSASGIGVSGPVDNAVFPALGVDSAGNPAVAWTDPRSGTSQVFARRFNGVGWEELGGSDSGTGVSQSSASAWSARVLFDDTDRLVVSYLASDTGATQLYLKRWSGSAWEELAGSASGAGLSAGAIRVYGHLLDLDGNGDPVVAWVEGGRVHVRRWDGVSWEHLLDTASWRVDFSPGYSESELALDQDLNPSVVWDSGPWQFTEVFYLRWDGAAWQELGGHTPLHGLGVSEGLAVKPELTLDQQDRPLLGWQEWGATSAAWRWDGAGWVTLEDSPGDGSPAGHDDSTRWAGSPGGAMVAAWLVGTPELGIKLMRWDGAAWGELAGSATGAGLARGFTQIDELAVALGPGDNPVLVWGADGASGHNIYLLRYDGAAWEELAGSASGDGLSGTADWSAEQSVAVDLSGRPVVVWNESNGSSILVRRYSGGAWEGLGGSDSAPGIGTSIGLSFATELCGPSIAIDSQERPVVTWASSDGIYLKRYDGAGWEELGGSATGAGVGAAFGLSAADYPRCADVAVDTADRPYVVWQDQLLGAGNVDLARWTGTAWEPLGNVVNGGGVSNSLAYSLYPSVAVGQYRVCVAWSENVFDTQQIMLRCHALN